MCSIQAAFVGDIQLAETNRVYIRDEVMIKIGQKKNKIYHFFLFNDILVYADVMMYGKHEVLPKNVCGKVIKKGKLFVCRQGIYCFAFSRNLS